MPEFPALNHVALTVRDLSISAPWYRELIGIDPLLDEATLDVEECTLQLGIGQSFRRIGFEVGGERGHG